MQAIAGGNGLKGRGNTSFDTEDPSEIGQIHS